jgi:NTP pyrophosphatase (non-canonical NTP hydrolase)
MDNYIELAKRTESLQFNTSKVNERILHGVIGLSTESGELLDAVKKSLFYGRDLDKQNLREEIGDILWYTALLMDALDYSFEQAMADNIAKLAKRYPDGFKDVLVRDQNDELSHIGG